MVIISVRFVERCFVCAQTYVILFVYIIGR